MIVKQIYTKCLAQASYFIESNGEVAIIDPIRDINEYIDLIGENKLKYILETHFHADFISGHLELAKKYSAPIIFGPNASPSYKFISKKDGDIIKLGNVKIKILHTPGHTLESISFLLFDENDEQYAVFTGDTLFVGDVGIPDVAQRYQNISKEELAAILYNSLNKLMKLDDDVILYPGHGKGTQCGKNLSNETYSTIGNQKKLNYALNFENEYSFINEICSNIPEPPNYFIEAVNKNANGYKYYNELINDSLIPLNQSKFIEIVNKKECIILDTRNPNDYAKKHLINSINIGLNGSFAVSVGNLIDNNKKILLVCNNGEEVESFDRLLRVGFDKIEGYLEGSIDSWVGDDLIDKIDQVQSVHLTNNYSNHQILDVRTKNEYKLSHLDGSINLPLYDIISKKNFLNKETKYLIHCQTGYRSMIASSLLKNMGFEVVEIKDGFIGFLNSNSKKIKS